MTDQPPDVRTSSYGYSESGGVQVRFLPVGLVDVTDAAGEADGDELTFTFAEWSAFLQGVLAGEFDLPSDTKRPTYRELLERLDAVAVLVRQEIGLLAKAPRQNNDDPAAAAHPTLCNLRWGEAGLHICDETKGQPHEFHHCRCGASLANARPDPTETTT